jgi:hypothetical protein
MTQTKTRSDSDGGMNSPPAADAFDAGASALADGIAGAFCNGLGWRICSRLIDAFAPESAGTTRGIEPIFAPSPVPHGEPSPNARCRRA